MNSQFTGLSYEQVLNISSTLGTDAQKMNTLLDEVKTLLNNVGNENTWSGTAAAETKATLDTLIKQFPEFYNAVNDMSKYLAQVVANYQTADRSITSN